MLIEFLLSAIRYPRRTVTDLSKHAYEEDTLVTTTNPAYEIEKQGVGRQGGGGGGREGGKGGIQRRYDIIMVGVESEAVYDVIPGDR